MKNIKDCYQKEIKDMVNRQFYFKEKSLLVLEMPQVFPLRIIQNCYFIVDLQMQLRCSKNMCFI